MGIDQIRPKLFFVALMTWIKARRDGWSLSAACVCKTVLTQPEPHSKPDSPGLYPNPRQIGRASCCIHFWLGLSLLTFTYPVRKVPRFPASFDPPKNRTCEGPLEDHFLQQCPSFRFHVCLSGEGSNASAWAPRPRLRPFSGQRR